MIIDSSGYRLNIGIILTNADRKLFWAKRVNRDAWQFPQGGMHQGESPEVTLYRELREEIGLKPEDVSILARTRHWLRYQIPKRLIRNTRPLCIGQKQLWYLLRLESNDKQIHLDHCSKPEFDHWVWVNYWYPLREVVLFKREVYRRAMRELAPYLFESAPKSWDRHPLDSLSLGFKEVHGSPISPE